MDNKLKKDSLKIVRYSPPNKFDHAPHMTQCVVLTKEKNIIYMQTSKDSSEPKWELM